MEPPSNQDTQVPPRPNPTRSASPLPPAPDPATLRRAAAKAEAAGDPDTARRLRHVAAFKERRLNGWVPQPKIPTSPQTDTHEELLNRTTSAVATATSLFESVDASPNTRLLTGYVATLAVSQLTGRPIADVKMSGAQPLVTASPSLASVAEANAQGRQLSGHALPARVWALLADILRLREAAQAATRWPQEHVEYAIQTADWMTRRLSTYIRRYAASSDAELAEAGILQAVRIVEGTRRQRRVDASGPRSAQRGRSRIHAYAPVIFVSVIALGVFAWVATKDLATGERAPSPQNAAPQQRAATPAAPLGTAPSPFNVAPVPIRTGIVESPKQAGVAPFRVATRGSTNYFVKLIDSREQTVISIYVTGGQSFETTVPLGIYRLRYATGNIWYGLPHYFGPASIGQEAEGIFNFALEGNTYIGHTVELFLQVDGNLETEEIPMREF